MKRSPNNDDATSTLADFTVGESVKVRGLRGIYEVVQGPDKNGKYLLTCGSLELRTSDIIKNTSHAITSPKAKRPKSTNPQLTVRIKTPGKAPRRLSPLELSENAKTSQRIDLHGLTASEAIEKVELSISTALINCVSSLEIIHGCGQGILKQAVKQYLSNSPHISRFEPSLTNPGVTWVYL